MLLVLPLPSALLAQRALVCQEQPARLMAPKPVWTLPRLPSTTSTRGQTHLPKGVQRSYCSLRPAAPPSSPGSAKRGCPRAVRPCPPAQRPAAHAGIARTANYATAKRVRAQ